MDQTPRPQRRELSSFGRSLPLTTAVLAILLALVLVPYLVRRISQEVALGRERARATVARENLEDLNLSDVSYRFRQLVTAVAPSVVHINTVVGRAAPDVDGLSFFLRPQATVQQVGQGSGVIVDSAGYIVTNYHVIRSATKIQVTLSDQSVRNAELIGADPYTDLAVLKVSGGDLAALDWEPDDSDAFSPGSLVWALGSPFGLDHSVTMGIISARGRHAVSSDGQFNPYQDFLQHDAAVNPGNSGGPLVGPTGKVVGINTLIVSKSGGFQGVSFAIPSNIAREVYERIRADGNYSRGHVGVALSEVTESLRRQLNLPNDKGALVRRVMPGSPAQTAGVIEDDVFVEWNGNAVDDVLMFSRLVGRTKPGTKVEAVVIRGGQRIKLTILVGERPAEL
jgi:S1-C subfamily serine protease